MSKKKNWPKYVLREIWSFLSYYVKFVVNFLLARKCISIAEQKVLPTMNLNSVALKTNQIKNKK